MLDWVNLLGELHASVILPVRSPARAKKVVVPCPGVVAGLLLDVSGTYWRHRSRAVQRVKPGTPHRRRPPLRPSGGSTYSPTTSRILGSSVGSVENLNPSLRWAEWLGWREKAETAWAEAADLGRWNGVRPPPCSVVGSVGSHERLPGRPARARPPGRAQQAGRPGRQASRTTNSATSASPQAARLIHRRGEFGNDGT
jgi:hypothetical protein